MRSVLRAALISDGRWTLPNINGTCEVVGLTSVTKRK